MQEYDNIFSSSVTFCHLNLHEIRGFFTYCRYLYFSVKNYFICCGSKLLKTTKLLTYI